MGLIACRKVIDDRYYEHFRDTKVLLELISQPEISLDDLGTIRMPIDIALVTLLELILFILIC